MAAFDINDPESIVSPGGVGFDINCGVRLIRTNLTEKDVLPVKVAKKMIIQFFNIRVKTYLISHKLNIKTNSQFL